MPLASSSFIPLLNHDVLAFIFYLNTHTPETEKRSLQYWMNKPVSALNTARHTSQVCRSWRQIILQSPTIWANIIDLGSLNICRDNENWFKEVMKRTVNARLSIYGYVRDSFLANANVLASLLETNWHRVRRLDIVISEDGRSVMANGLRNIFWKRQAPDLEVFSVDIDYAVDANGWGDLKLFAGSAPSLRHIHSSPIFNFDHRTPWIPHLLSMTLAGPVKISDALKVIANAPLLESLVIDSTAAEYDEDGESWTQKIHLPNLHRIDIAETNIVGSLAYLTHISPRSDCALILDMYAYATDLHKPDIFQQLSKIILCYSKRYFDAHCPVMLDIRITDVDIEISSNPTCEPVYFGHPRFKISLHSRSAHPSIDIEVINILLSTLVSATLKTVNHFWFSLSHLSWYPETDDSIQIFRSLTSITKLTLTPLAIHAVNNLLNSEALFPCLTEVIVRYYGREEYLRMISTLPILLTRRKEVGHPVRALYIFPSYPSRDYLQGVEEWVFLQEFEGLQGFYLRHDGRMEFLCGSGEMGLAGIQDVKGNGK